MSQNIVPAEPEPQQLELNQEPTIQTWYRTDELKFVRSHHGTECLMFRGYRFYFLRELNRENCTRWRCCVKECPNKLCTRGTNLLKVSDGYGHQHDSYERKKNRPVPEKPVQLLAAGQVPRRGVWYTGAELQFRNDRKPKILHFRNNLFVYTRSYTNLQGTTSHHWQCLVHKCPGSATSDDQNNVKFNQLHRGHGTTRKGKTAQGSDNTPSTTPAVPGTKPTPSSLASSLKSAPAPDIVEVKHEPLDSDLL